MKFNLKPIITQGGLKRSIYGEGYPVKPDLFCSSCGYTVEHTVDALNGIVYDLREDWICPECGNDEIEQDIGAFLK